MDCGWGRKQLTPEDKFVNSGSLLQTGFAIKIGLVCLPKMVLRPRRAENIGPGDDLSLISFTSPDEYSSPA